MVTIDGRSDRRLGWNTGPDCCGREECEGGIRREGWYYERGGMEERWEK